MLLEDVFGPYRERFRGENMAALQRALRGILPTAAGGGGGPPLAGEAGRAALEAAAAAAAAAVGRAVAMAEPHGRGAAAAALVRALAKAHRRRQPPAVGRRPRRPLRPLSPVVMMLSSV